MTAASSSGGTSLRVEERGGNVLFDVRVSPSASRTSVLGVHDGALKLSLAAPAVEGAANAALVKFLAHALGVPQKAVTLLRGQRGRLKTISVAGVDPERVRALGT